MISYLNSEKISSEKIFLQNKAFLEGDAVKVFFFVRYSKLILAEECYFFLMASMRKMRMNIPLSFTLEFFTHLFEKSITENNFEHAKIMFLAFRNREENYNAKTKIQYYFEIEKSSDLLQISKNIEMDLLKEISVNTNLLSNILVHSPENIYAHIYAQENDLDELILLNPNKRIARGIYGNLLFLEENTIKISKQTEGAYISPLMENFVTFVYKNQLAIIEETEIIAFESQKAEEILLVSDQKGLQSVFKIRNKTFDNKRFTELIEKWRNNFAQN